MVFDWSKYLTTGIRSPSGGSSPQQRKEIRNLKPEEKWLFLQGMAKFQAVPMNEYLSYYQIAGIHGLPYQTWPNDEENTDIPRKRGIVSRDNFYGFCTHSSIIFLTWHRPYLALFEATLYKHVNDIANGIDPSFRDKATYVNYAKNFRMPYWDWAVNSPIFPEAALNNTPPSSSPSVNIAGFKSPDYNPLFRFPFQSKDPSEITLRDPRSGNRENPTTVRYPSAGSDAVRQLTSALNDFFENAGTFFSRTDGLKERNLAERIAYIVKSYQRYGPMSSNRFRGNDLTSNAETWGSMEDVHNTIHDLTGGGGHMSNPSIAAFDPIFWLHHTNIDRIFAIWEALNQRDDRPETWVSNQSAGSGGWGTKATVVDRTTRQLLQTGDTETATMPLWPFRDTTTSWWNSNMVKRTETFGYTYPETQGLTYPLNTQARLDLTRVVDNLYPSASSVVARSLRRVETAGQELLPQATVLRQMANNKVPATHRESMTLANDLPDQQTLLKRSLEPSKPVIRDLAPDRKYLEWLVNIKAEKHALGGEYSVTVFLGPVEEEEVILWPISPNFVGTFAPFGQTGDTECGKCREDQREHLQITGQIPLTLALIERYLAEIVPDISVGTVVPYLRENLHWRVQSNGAVINDQSQVDGLTVFAVSNEVTIPEDPEELPVYAPDVTIHPDITTNRTGDGRGHGTGLVAGQQ